MNAVRAQLLAGLGCALVVLTALHVAVGLTPIGWAVGAGFDAATLGLLARGWLRAGAGDAHPADQVTLFRATLAGGAAALVCSFSGAGDIPVLVGLAVAVLLLDAVDGRLARRTQTQSALGARFDMEVDAFLILVLSVHVARDLGAWVLVIGLARYALLAAGFAWPWLRRPVPPRYWAKVVAATQGIVLTTVAADVLPTPLEVAITVAALALLVESFARQLAFLAREQRTPSLDVLVAEGDADTTGATSVTGRSGGSRRVRAGLAPYATVLAAVVVWLALALPDRLDRLAPATFVQIPAEGLLLTAAAVLLPTRARQVVASVVGVTLGVLVLLKVLDMGYYAQVNRAFNPVMDWSSLGPALGVVRDSVGSAGAFVAAGAAVLVGVGVVAASVWASLRWARTSATHRRRSTWLVGSLGIVWITCATVGVSVLPETPVASRWTTSFAVAEARSVATAAEQQRRFGQQLAAADPYSAMAPDDLLAGLRGKDVVIAFVESYGRTAVEGSTFTPGVASVLDAGTESLAAAGYSSRSAFLTSPTFGGISWLAHATLQSGLWVDTKQVHDQLLGSSRFTLSAAFQRAGWRTVLAAPANTRPWPEGKAFYRYDHLYDATNTGYRGPRFSYATMPDQYTLAAFQRLELGAGHAPVMAELDLVSSHIPWVPVPDLIDWDDVGDGSVYASLPAQGPSAATVYRDDDALKAAYGRSIEYSLESLISFVQTAGDDDLVLVLLGDHQPSPRVSGPEATHDVPVTIIARDPAVMDRIAAWGWQPGLRPGADAEVWRMDAFRNRFLDAFAGPS